MGFRAVVHGRETPRTVHCLSPKCVLIRCFADTGQKALRCDVGSIRHATGGLKARGEGRSLIAIPVVNRHLLRFRLRLVAEILTPESVQARPQSVFPVRHSRKRRDLKRDVEKELRRVEDVPPAYFHACLAAELGTLRATLPHGPPPHATSRVGAVRAGLRRLRHVGDLARRASWRTEEDGLHSSAAKE